MIEAPAVRHKRAVADRMERASPTALTAEEAEEFHQWQANELASAGAEYLLAQTIPAVSEGEGMARAMIATGVPSIVSFCITREGRVLDGCPLGEAITRIDETTAGALMGYMVNCSHPTFPHPEKMGNLCIITHLREAAGIACRNR